MNTFSFDNFLVSETNRFAKEACIRFANSLGELYNPLLIYGANGTGKTHLLNSIKRNIEDKNADMNIILVTGEQFANEVIENMRAINNAESMNKMRQRYYNADILIIDDLDWLQHLEATREELLHVIERIMNDGKKLVVSSTTGINELFVDCPKFKLQIDIFYVASIEKPNAMLIDSILNKNILEGLCVSDDVKDYLKEHAGESITKLKGMINTMKMWIDIYDHEPSLAEVENIFEAAAHYSYKINV
ncbi:MULTISPECIES: DnaA/Hda family protein [Pseudobutyrivibrio]|uniref:AAA family ATPase n=1 Tax=Pseudobutyrivibrio xylanivorans TaxID=185007 RepID=A0A6M0LGW8_PSEXY|nr:MULTISPECIES: DnaA/Hda family protein [Pseudobutyrivibrio]NEX01772.1 AAA family ATPase [Pseudobutyrivibrio xylanivorans]